MDVYCTAFNDGGPEHTLNIGQCYTISQIYDLKQTNMQA